MQRQLSGDVPRQEFVDPVDGMVGDVGQDVTQIGLRIDAVEFAGPNERVHGGRTLAATVGAGE
uniref:Uncharacterized protein n=1 Tax=Cupriavidus taiwanensis TaxID=164546 RepID=A0A375HCA5_9BURK|nr:protein of unknown function [Cupriavidus taiwanensis]SPD49088.1 protein of unknown function [Cupriavidus taiwanensis]